MLWLSMPDGVATVTRAKAGKLATTNIYYSTTLYLIQVSFGL